MNKPINNRPEVLVYRRTHKGDPCENGVFGCHDCLGTFRDWSYNAVIGVGGTNPLSGNEGISRKVNWIGIGPTKTYDDNKRGPLVTFGKFILWDEEGILLDEDAYPNLFQYMFKDGKIPRAGKKFREGVDEEILQLLEIAEKDGKESRGCPQTAECGKGKSKNCDLQSRTCKKKKCRNSSRTRECGATL